MKRETTIVFVVSMLILATSVAAEVDVPRASQKAAIMQTVGLTEIEIVYSRPGVKERQIWGELVPFGELWRTGANEATTIEFSTDVTVEGHDVPAGKYALFTIPGEASWTVILNSDWEQPGTSRYDEAKNVASFDVAPEDGPFQEWMTFHIPEITDSSATIVLAWKNTRVPIDVTVDTSEIVLERAREELRGMGWVQPYRAANYAYAEGMVNEESLGWIDRSVMLEETWWNLSLKARMLAKAGKTNEAKATAKKAIARAKGMENPPNTAELETEMKSW